MGAVVRSRWWIVPIAVVVLGAALFVGTSSRSRRRSGARGAAVSAVDGRDADSAGAAGEADGENEAENTKARDDWFYGQREFPSGSIPSGALAKAQSQAGALSARSAVTPFDVPALSFKSIGPHPITSAVNTYYNGTAPYSGRVSRIATDPTNASVAYAGAATGGVWKTTDAGTNWTPMFDGQATLSIGGLAVDPTHPATVYAGTGEGDSLDSYLTSGLYRSTAGGVGWSKIGGAAFDNCSFYDIALKPGTPTTLYAAVADGSRYNVGLTNACSFANGRSGVYRSTTGGSTWTRILATARPTDLVVDPTVPNNVWVAAFGAVYKSTNGGGSFTPVGLPAFLGRAAIATSPTDPQHVYAVLSNGGNDLEGIYSSTNGGTTWKVTTAPLFCNLGNNAQCNYDLTIAVDPTDPTIFYAGGIQLYRFTNSGASYTRIGGVSGAATVHDDFHTLAFSGATDRLWVGSDGGAYRSDDRGNTFTNLNADLELTQFISIAGRGGTAGPIIGGTQDNGTVRYSGAVGWTEPRVGDGGYAGQDATLAHVMYSTATNLQVKRSDDGGVTFPNNVDPTIPNPFLPPPATTSLLCGGDCLFYAPIAAHPNIAGAVYAGSRFLWRSVNRGANWAKLSPRFSSDISAIGIGAANVNTAYVGLSGGGISVTFDGGATTWRRGVGLPNRWVTRIVVNPRNSNEAYATVSGFGTGHVWHTLNGGGSWTNASGNMPDVATSAIAVSWLAKTMYIGTDVGMMRSADGGTNWEKISAGLPNAPILDLMLDPDNNTLTVATYGRGAFQASLVSSQTFPLSVQVSGAGTVVSDPAVIKCGSGQTACNTTLPGYMAIQLTATAHTGLVFTRWTGACTGSSRVCVVTMGAAKTVRAVFSPNKTVFWYKPTTGDAFLSTLSGGVYSPGQNAKFSAGWSNIAISRDTALFYNATNGHLSSGLMLDGVYQQNAEVTTILGATNLAATCDSAVLYHTGALTFQTYRLVGGAAIAANLVPVSADYDTVVGSCDSVLFFNSQFGFGIMGTLKNGVWTQVSSVPPGALTGWNRVVATDDSIFFMNTTNEHQAYGTFTGGHFVQTHNAVSTPACADDRWAATGDSVLDMRVCASGTTALTGILEAGVFTPNPTLLHPNSAFTILAGGK